MHSLGQLFLLSEVCLSGSGRTGAGVPSQRSDAQQPDGGDDSGLHALQAGTAAQPAECKWCCWKRSTPLVRFNNR